MITGKILQQHGWPQGKIIGLAKELAANLAEIGLDDGDILDALSAIRERPGDFLADHRYANLARECIRREAGQPVNDELRANPLGFPIWGEDQIDREARSQMENALRLPIAIAGVLMPDAHIGYGLPIGGVLATDGAVIPYAVGVDIACRMRLSIYPVSPHVLGQRAAQFRKALLEETRFGMRGKWDPYNAPTHEVLDDSAWTATRLLKSLQSKAKQQLATSGTGNHFVEWGAFTLLEDMDDLGIQAGKYLALLSHSGSRGVGYKIANTYTEIAAKLHPQLDGATKRLAWLPLHSEPGQQYWLSMELAGRFAAANHAVIHQRVAAAAGLKEIAYIENHHNFAWRETLPDGNEAIVHRKGATPAGPGVLGIIPGSMGDAGYVVRGRGSPASLNSASHGAGRKISRRQAIESITQNARDNYLRERGITLLGGGLDESPQAYKDIQQVIAAQDELIEVIGKFTPRIVRMADESGDI
jgi:tRNA-splicing ligase RtcB (3'-phosphate/5'-hydroxy nucleic acid ligase)